MKYVPLNGIIFLSVLFRGYSKALYDVETHPYPSEEGNRVRVPLGSHLHKDNFFKKNLLFIVYQ